MNDCSTADSDFSIFLITFNRDRIQVFKIEDKIKIKNICIDIEIFDQRHDIDIE